MNLDSSRRKSAAVRAGARDDKAPTRAMKIQSRTGRAKAQEATPRAKAQEATPRAKAQEALKTQLRETVRAQILDAAEELIADRGLHAAGLAQIAQNAGIAVGTLYNYFADRDAMVRALFESRRATLRPRVLEVAGMGADLKFEPRLRHFMQGMLGVFDEHRRFLKVSMETEHLKISPSTLAADVNAAIEAIVASGVAERAIDSKKAPLLVPVISGAMRAIIMRRVVDKTPFAADSDMLVNLFLDGARKR